MRRLLAVHSIPIPQLPPDNPPPTKPVEPPPPVDKEERARQRIALFRNLFRGREDVYARRWENADGRHGYMPAVVKDWKAINKSRPEDQIGRASCREKAAIRVVAGTSRTRADGKQVG